MLIENLSYLATFVASMGIAAIGTMLSYQLFHENKKAELQILLYQQIFLFSFFIYGIWGNLALREIIADVNLNDDLAAKLAFFIPLLGIPFLIVSWFMLLKFGFNVNGYHASKRWVYFYFSAFVIALISVAFLFQNKTIGMPLNPDTFIIRLFAAINLFFHLLFIYPFFKSKTAKSPMAKMRTLSKCIFVYTAGVAACSVALWYFDVFGFISTTFSILILFATSALLPVCLRFWEFSVEEKAAKSNKNFESFCRDYEISKREAEIILEICSGKTNKAISEKLFIALQTVKDHTHHIYTKTQVKSRVQLANLVRERVEDN